MKGNDRLVRMVRAARTRALGYVHNATAMVMAEMLDAALAVIDDEPSSNLLVEFVRESNRIEGIRRPPTSAEVEATERLIFLADVKVSDLEEFVGTVQPGARLRCRNGMNVQVGSYTPPPGGPRVVWGLESLLDRMRLREIGSFNAHVEYETLHPFTDGNGRSGRALWAWQFRRDGGDPFSLGFLHQFYYQTLEHLGR